MLGMNNSSMNFTILEKNQTMDPFTIILISISCLTFVFGIPAHCFVAWFIVKRTNRVSSEIFRLNLSVCEIGVAFSGFFFVLSLLCLSFETVSNSFLGLSVTGRPLFQFMMCFERYLAVIHPVTFLKYKPLRYRVFCCSVAWIIVIGSCVIYLKLTTLSNEIPHVSYFSSQFLIFFFAQLFCLVTVLKALKQMGPGESKDKENHMKRRAFKQMLIITLSMATTYVPSIVYGFIFICTGVHVAAIWLSAMLCYYLASFVHPVLFLGKFGKLPLLSKRPGTNK